MPVTLLADFPVVDDAYNGQLVSLTAAPFDNAGVAGFDAADTAIQPVTCPSTPTLLLAFVILRLPFTVSLSQ